MAYIGCENCCNAAFAVFGGPLDVSCSRHAPSTLDCPTINFSYEATVSCVADCEGLSVEDMAISFTD